MATPIPPAVSAWLTETVGSHRWLDTIQDHGRSAVWRIATSDSELIIKQVKTVDRWHREVHAYRAWSGALAPHVPKLIALSTDHQCLLLTALRGIPMKHVRLPDALALNAYTLAGQLARRFRDAAVGTFFGDPSIDGKPLDKSWSDPVEFIRSDFQSAFERVVKDGGLEERSRAVAIWGERNLDAFSGEPCVPVNGDYDTGNWLVDERDGFIGVIDFECARWGVEYETFMPIWTRDYARLCDGAEETFMAAYGYELNDRARRQRSVGFIKDALHGVVYSLDHNLKTLDHHRDCLRALERLT